MLFFWKMRRNSGSFLIEVIASIVVMSIGLLTVMQVYASQRRLATMNEKQTQDGLVLADRLDAVLAGADLRALYAQERADLVQVESKTLTGDREGLIESVKEGMVFEAPADCRNPEAFHFGQRWSLLFVGFVLDVMERALQDQVQRLYFLTREGVFFLKIYEALAAHHALGFEVKPGSLLNVSRLATFAASLRDFSIKEMMRLWTLYSVQSLGALFRTLGLDPKAFEALTLQHGLTLDDPITYPWQHGGVIAFFEDQTVQDLILPFLQEKRNVLLAYLEAEGLPSEKARIGIVDIGWRGSIQDNLALMHPHLEMVGYYLGLNGFLNEQPLNAPKWAFGPDARDPDASIDLLHQVAPIEMLTNSSSGSVTGFALRETGVEIKTRVDEGESHVHEAFVADFQRGVLATLPAWAEAIRIHALSASDLRPPALRIWRSMIESPPAFLGVAYFKLNHNETFGVGGFVDKGLTLSPWAIWAAFLYRPARIRLVEAINSIGWLEGLMARRDLDLMIRLPLRLFLKVTRYQERLKSASRAPERGS